MVLYDDMKLAFNGLMSQILGAQVSEEAFIERTLQVSDFGYRLDQCMGLDPEGADNRYAASQERDKMWPSQLAHDKSKRMRTKSHIKKLLSGNKFSTVVKGTRRRKSRTVGRDSARPNAPEPTASKISTALMYDCRPKEPMKFDNPDDLR